MLNSRRRHGSERRTSIYLSALEREDDGRSSASEDDESLARVLRLEDSSSEGRSSDKEGPCVDGNGDNASASSLKSASRKCSLPGDGRGPVDAYDALEAGLYHTFLDSRDMGPASEELQISSDSVGVRSTTTKSIIERYAPSRRPSGVYSFRFVHNVFAQPVQVYVRMRLGCPY